MTSSVFKLAAVHRQRKGPAILGDNHASNGSILLPVATPSQLKTVRSDYSVFIHASKDVPALLKAKEGNNLACKANSSFTR